MAASNLLAIYFKLPLFQRLSSRVIWNLREILQHSCSQVYYFLVLFQRRQRLARINISFSEIMTIRNISLAHLVFKLISKLKFFIKLKRLLFFILLSIGWMVWFRIITAKWRITFIIWSLLIFRFFLVWMVLRIRTFIRNRGSIKLISIMFARRQSRTSNIFIFKDSLLWLAFLSLKGTFFINSLSINGLYLHLSMQWKSRLVGQLFVGTAIFQALEKYLTFFWKLMLYLYVIIIGRFVFH